ncbi:hypothetical protein ETAA8_13720 [Anatilimnocola aggregata]|uniref:Uncharacterized protein n=1 Tax=Anatilimnocola aggregata TaxID=2528021 RepID=A0A517Y7S7_9BACT|nr:DUF4919 domain-containing protein [Anatilimnocola aggregata]QDU26294.1 hypothetical protein ETAA8_13720 [Anatilimnocola aggregata]
MFQEFARFLTLPSRATYLAARRAWLQLNVEPLTPADLQGVAELLAAGEATAVIERVHGWQSRAALSPRAHYFAAEAHESLGESEPAEMERWVFSACLQGILATGDGTRRKPYIVSQLSDEYDVLKLLGLRSEKQQLVQRGRRSCDVLTCHDGSHLWFNVSDLIAVPEEAISQAPLVEIKRTEKGVIRTTRRISDPLRAVPR